MRWRRGLALAGLAGMAGVTATGVAVARAERRRRSYPPEEIRARLHRRVEAAHRAGSEGTVGRASAPGAVGRASAPGATMDP